MSQQHPIHRQISAFLIVGSLATIVHYGLMISLVEGQGWTYLPATLIGFLGGATVSYLLNRRHTYSRQMRRHSEASWRFLIVATTGFGLTFVSGYIFVNLLGFPYIFGQMITTGIVLVWNFTANRIWTFKS